MRNHDRIPLHPFALLALAVVTTSAPLGAQTVGDRVRVSSGDTRIVGRITGLSADGFELAHDDQDRSFAYRDLDRLEVLGGTRTCWGDGASVGSFLLGAALAFSEEEIDVFEGSLMGGLLGFGLGVVSPFIPPVLGHPRPSEDERSWRPISVRDYFVPLLGDEFPYGGRVRVSSDGGRLVGRATAMTDEGFELVQAGTSRSFAYRDIDGLEWSRGMRSRWKAGWGLGLLGGIVAYPTFTGTWGCVTRDWEGPSCEEKGRDMFSWIGAGGLLGLGVGAFLWRYESWEPFALRDSGPGISPAVALRLLGAGDRVRVTVAGETTVGEVVRVGPDVYEIDLRGSGLVSLRLSEMELLQRSIGVGNRRVEGLVFGGVVGLAIGAAIANTREADGGDIDPDEIFPRVPTESSESSADDGELLIEVISGVAGAAAGLGVGTLLKKERWVTLWAPPDRGADTTFTPVIDVRHGRDGRFAAVLGGRIRF
ncbi:MAG: hypothetical protein F4238_02175 [Gemmatimonadetes bacterium]|nr:hypothetical protein [Gemmatimonadota bacterium]